LPIDDSLAEIREALRAGRSVVVEAPPGAGKTTRVPRSLLDVYPRGQGQIWVLEPRRLAARLAAVRVADELGERPGTTVGYAVRFDEVAGPNTRLHFLTEGLFLRRLLAAPTLPGVAAVVIDEIHERHVATDLALAWLRRLRETSRPELGVVAMSATVDAKPVHDFLAAAGGAVHVHSPGRRFDVDIEYADQPEQRPLDQQVVAAVRRAVRTEPDGDVLVFLPGAGEIRRAQEALAALPGLSDTLVLPLHGDMPLDDQTRAVRPADRRKIVLATNVAESSITVDGVVTVVDSGVARIATSSPWTGFPSLSVAKVSRASAIQRAGRAGRTRPGRVLRLYSRVDFDQRPEHDPPELERTDLAELGLVLATLGVRDPADLAWLEPPPAPAWGAARELLQRLNAVDAAGALTDTGREMSHTPLQPRLGRLVVEGRARGVGRAACLAAALISERDIRAASRTRFGGGPRDRRVDTGAEIVDLVDLYREAEAQGFRPDALRRLELDRRAIDEVRRVFRALTGDSGRGARAVDTTAEARGLRMAMLAGFPDRVARRREGDRRTVVFAAGGSATLGFEPSSDWMVAVDVSKREAGTRGGGVEVRLAADLEPEWLLDLFSDRITDVDRRAFNPDTGWVERTSALAYGALLLEESTEPAPPDDETARLLAEAALARGIERLPGGGGLAELAERLAFARRAAPDAPLPAETEINPAGLVRAACIGRRSLAELEDLSALALAGLPPRARQALETLAPARVTLGNGRSVPIHYDASAPPWIESRLQDFFGTSTPPTVGGGRVPLTVHLLAPNGRAVQVTSDLPRFWREHYPPLRRELGRRYPKHAWPEDGATARPPPPPTPGRRR